MDCAYAAAVDHYFRNRYLFVEIKPSVSDDYPVTMRQMKMARNIIAREGIGESGLRRQVLYTEKITSKHLTEAQIIAMFDAGKISVVTKAMVEGL